MIPAHDHDCEGCIYVGSDAPQPGERRVNQVDMYICNNSLIRRYSSEPSDYGSSLLVGLVGGPGERYLRVVAAAHALGYTWQETSTPFRIRWTG